jgi:hypothetical protein
MSTYIELLKHPEWQKMRLKILERDKFKCRYCLDKETTLHVHHMYYTNHPDGERLKPWEYHPDSLITLCEKCHSNVDKFDWQRAFCDLGIEPGRLLEIALYYKYQLNKLNTENPALGYNFFWLEPIVSSESERSDFYDNHFVNEFKKYIKE